MAITIAQLQAMNFGYLSGADLAQWCNQQLLISTYNARPQLFPKAVNQAISEVRSKLFNVYDLTDELSLTDSLTPIATPIIAAGVITGATIIQPGSNIIAAPTAAAVDNTGSGATLTAVVSASTVTGFEILTGGQHFKQAPSVSFVGGNPTSPATAIAQIDSWGHVINLVITYAGTGYQSVPAIELTSVDGFGIGANAIALVTFGQLTGITVNAGGTTYSPNAVINFSGNYQIADQREPKLVKLMSIFSVYNALGSSQNYSEKMTDDYKSAVKDLVDIRSGMDNLQLYGAKSQIRSSVKLVYDKFKQIG